MSMLSSVSRVSSNVVIPGSSGASPALGSVVPKRFKSFKIRPDRSKKNMYQGGQLVVPKRVERPGTFLPLPRPALGHPKFEPDREETLDLPAFEPQNLRHDAAGQVMVFKKPQHGIIKSYGVPRNLLLEYRVLSKPCTVIRDITLSTIQKLEKAGQSSSSRTRAVLTGPVGSGKSTLLLQAVEYCHEKDWIVLYVPRAAKLIDSSTQYVYDAQTGTYLQPAFTHQLLRRFRDVNSSLLKKLRTTKAFEHSNSQVLDAQRPLAELVEIGARRPQEASKVLTALLSELGAQKTCPVLLAVDDFQALYCKTKYRDPRFKTLRAHHLSLPRTLLQYASGQKEFARGAVLGAITMTDTTFQVPLELREALALSHDAPVTAYDRRNWDLIQYSKGLQSIPVPSQLKLNEAASLYQVWGEDRALNDVPTDHTFLRLYTETSGNARDFIWKGVVSSLAT